jgi:Chaperonin 10 Kd subunit
LVPRRPVAIEPGEVVLFSPYAGVKVSVEGDDFLLLREQDVLGVLDGAELPDEFDDAGYLVDAVAD